MNEPNDYSDNVEAEHDMYLVVENAEPERFPLFEGKSLLIGRYSKTLNTRQNIIIKDKSKKVSREHMVVSRMDECVKIEVIGKNGIVLKGKLYKKGETAILHPYESLMIADYKCEIESDATAVMDESIFEHDRLKDDNNLSSIQKSIKEKKCNRNIHQYNNSDELSNELSVQENYYCDDNVNHVHHVHRQQGLSLNKKYFPRDEDENRSNSDGLSFQNNHQSLSLSPGTEDEYRSFDINSLSLNYRWKSFAEIVIMFALIGIIFFGFNYILSSDIKQNQEIKPIGKATKENRSYKTSIFHENIIKYAIELIQKGKLNDAEGFLNEIPYESEYYEEAKKLIHQIKKK